MTRTAIAGVPKAGKTTLAYTFPGPLLHTDDVIHLGWSEASAEVATWFDRPDWRVIEGVAVPRALRKWLRSHADGRPCDQLIYLASYRQRPTREQEIMGRGCFSVMLEISPTLESRGVTIEWR